jgi:hypothetical protein
MHKHLLASSPGRNCVASADPMAVAFIEHALKLKGPRVALLRNDFDSALTCQHLFRHETRFTLKLVLLNRIKWFDGPSSPSDNHAGLSGCRTTKTRR